MTVTLTTPVQALSRVGAQIANRLSKLGIETAQDLIFYYPYRWQDFSKIVQITDVVPGDVVTIKGKIELISNRRSPVKRRMLTEALVTDDSGSVKVLWFNQPFLTKTLVPGDTVYLSGKVTTDQYSVEMISPIYEVARGGDTTHTARIVPMYSLTERLSQKQLRLLIKQSLSAITQVTDAVPAEVRSTYHLMELHDALYQIHFPDNNERLAQAIKRLAFDELFFFQLKIQIGKTEFATQRAEPVEFKEVETKRFVDSLPFTLTADQKKAAWTIISDMGKDRPMNRLLEGEVGSGKTIVAALALLNTSLAGRQGVFMAPTEILAEQHYKKIQPLFEPFGISSALVTRTKQRINGQVATKKEVIQKIRDGEALVIIGTHALIQEAVVFSSLALAIIDEQHRFGVDQRRKLRDISGEDGAMPHLLSMTATPIPRSLALVFYGDLDVSIIRQLPAERKRIITEVVGVNDRTRVYKFIKDQISGGRQAFVVCPLIDPSDRLGVRSVTEESKRLKSEVFPDLRITMLHGKMKPQDKDKAMADFLEHKSDILVSTSVVEVGVDVPNASVMVIEASERFGLAQLHQFRGRVGRAVHQSYCFLLTESNQEKTKKRLSAVQEARDGFELAEKDLAFRGPGEVYGTQQSGFPEFRFATLTDRPAIIVASEAASTLISNDPRLEKFPKLRKRISEETRDAHFE